MLRLNDCGNEVRTLQESLRMLGYRPGKVDGDFGEKTEAAVIEFQEAEGIYADGIVGPVTQSVLEEALKEFILEQQSPGPDSLVPEERDRLPFVRVDADVYRDGYDRFFLREDVAHAYGRVRERIVEAGGRRSSPAWRTRESVAQCHVISLHGPRAGPACGQRHGKSGPGSVCRGEG